MEIKNYDQVVAIDGPAGTGKSSLAKELAKKFNLQYVDTGAMYRALGVHFLHQKIQPEKIEEESVNVFLQDLDFSYVDGGPIKVNGLDVFGLIRAPEVARYASIVSQFGSVREYLVNYQRSLVKTEWCVMEGRDIGTNVFPGAYLKFYLDASPEVRAQRRFFQLKSSGKSVDQNEILAEIKARDERDQSRAIAPLEKAADAHYVDTDKLDFEQVLEKVSQVLGPKLELERG